MAETNITLYGSIKYPQTFKFNQSNKTEPLKALFFQNGGR